MNDAEQKLPKIIHKDNAILVFEKPSGWPSQAKPKVKGPSIEQWLREQNPGQFAGLIHRLDQNVSGIMIAARNSNAASILSAELKVGKIYRLYRGWVLGEVDQPQTLSHFHRKNEKLQMAEIQTAEFTHSKKATMKIIPIEQSTWGMATISLCEFELETGRYHQIRAQCAFMKFPILGDRKYGGDRKKHGRFSLGRPALHSSFLKITHPMSGKEMQWDCELPPELNL